MKTTPDHPFIKLVRDTPGSRLVFHTVSDAKFISDTHRIEEGLGLIVLINRTHTEQSQVITNYLDPAQIISVAVYDDA
jgi:hypothetical protein